MRKHQHTHWGCSEGMAPAHRCHIPSIYCTSGRERERKCMVQGPYKTPPMMARVDLAGLPNNNIPFFPTTALYPYTVDLLCLDFCRSRPGDMCPAFMREVHTSLNPPAWEAALAPHADRPFHLDWSPTLPRVCHRLRHAECSMCCIGRPNSRAQT
jgi:hypothetical protein